MSPQTITIVKATVPALEQHGPLITETMYRHLFRDAHIAVLFNQANQKKGTQRLALAHAVLAYARNIENLPALGAAVERIAQKHIGYAIMPEQVLSQTSWRAEDNPPAGHTYPASAANF
ncbi:hypothetical protein Q4494_15365 [Celeribacter halophilus]|uniref:Globin domain-containing protein n=1 Tax=Celeribacter halophilus TaxID=576117 RepID=A0AAW7XZZ2_9RHOB|nr:hypothetical protein [Celeribacter halophilus]MDO6458467.1 hypothetical protein [Celeribacter halophilus]